MINVPAIWRNVRLFFKIVGQSFLHLALICINLVWNCLGRFTLTLNPVPFFITSYQKYGATERNKKVKDNLIRLDINIWLPFISACGHQEWCAWTYHPAPFYILKNGATAEENYLFPIKSWLNMKAIICIILKSFFVKATSWWGYFVWG